MSFEIYTPGRRFARIVPGMVSINTNGRMTINGQDMRSVHIEQDATILFDARTRRIGLRRPREGEPVTGVRWNKSRTTCSISIYRILKQLGIDTATGVFRVAVVQKDDMHIVQLPDGHDREA
jgi:hypothetical protein